MNKQILCAMVAMASLVALSASDLFAGACGGSRVARDSVLARDTDDYVICFRGGELATIVVDGDRSTDLDLFIYDEDGNRIASDTDHTDMCVVSFVPRWTGQFRVRIVNRGWIYNSYLLRTN